MYNIHNLRICQLSRVRDADKSQLEVTAKSGVEETNTKVRVRLDKRVKNATYAINIDKSCHNNSL